VSAGLSVVVLQGNSFLTKVIFNFIG